MTANMNATGLNDGWASGSDVVEWTLDGLSAWALPPITLKYRRLIAATNYYYSPISHISTTPQARFAPRHLPTPLSPPTRTTKKPTFFDNSKSQVTRSAEPLSIPQRRWQNNKANSVFTFDIYWYVTIR